MGFSPKDRCGKALPWGRLPSVAVQDPQQGCAGWERQRRSGSSRAWQGQSCAPGSPFRLFQPNCSARAPSCLSTERGIFFFPPSCIRKQSDLAVLVICLQLSWLRCTSQETNIFLINFPVTFSRCCKLHWSYPFSDHCESVTELSPFYVADFKYLLQKTVTS